MDKILEFDYVENDNRRHFIFNAENFGLTFDDPYMEVQYDDFELLEVKGEQAKEFIPKAVSWTGRRLTQDDALEQSVSAYLNGDPRYEFSQVAQDIEAFKNEHIKTACTACGRDIADKYFREGYAHDLLLATDKAVYYAFDDTAVMLSAEDGSLISDNYFAEDGFMSSIEDVVLGKEKEIYAAGFLDELKEETAKELGVGLSDVRESVNMSLVDNSVDELEVSNEYE